MSPVSKYKVTSLHLKAALYAYWRFKRQFIVADEVGVCQTSMDIAVDTGGFLFEVEVKNSKSDLVQGEKRKDKHQRYVDIKQTKYIPNQYYVCVPTELVEAAKEWCKKTNPSYGILEYRNIGWGGWEDMIRVAKKAKFLHNEPITAHQKHEVAHRLSSALAMIRQGAAHQFREPVEEDWSI